MKKDKPIFPLKSISINIRNDGQFCQWYHFNGNLNSVVIVFCGSFSFHIVAVYTEVCVQSQFSGFAICAHLVFMPVNWVQVKRLTLCICI